MQTNIQFKNEKLVIEELKKNVEAVKTNIKLALAEGGKIVEAEAKRLVPVDTGKLKESLKATATFNMKTGYGIAVTAEKLDPFYAHYVEYGTHDPEHHQAAQPYMRPAIDNNIEKIKALINNAIFGAIHDV